jgi:HPt (histidine-containing phosphotransfer) domain-containing protein
MRDSGPREAAPSAERSAVNWATLEKFRKDTSEDLFRVLVDTFLSDTAAKLDQLHKLATQSPASKDAVRLVHSFKSSAAMAGADALSAAAAALEQELASNASTLNPTDAVRLNALFDAYRTALVERGIAV